MRAEFTGANLRYIVETDKELYSLVPDTMRPSTFGTKDLPADKEPLTSRLCTVGGVELTARATLSFVPQTLKGSGVDIDFKPAGAHNFDRLEGIDVRVAYHLFDQLVTNGIIADCYSGNNRIDIKFGR